LATICLCTAAAITAAQPYAALQGYDDLISLYYPDAKILDESIINEMPTALRTPSISSRTIKKLLEIDESKGGKYVLVISAVEEDSASGEIRFRSESAISAESVKVMVKKGVSKRRFRRALSRIRSKRMNVSLKRKMGLPEKGIYIVQFNAHNTDTIDEVAATIRTLSEVESVKPIEIPFPNNTSVTVTR